jgi:hypothetical protein
MAVVAVAVGHVVELVGPDGAVRLLLGELGGEAARVFDVVVRVLVGHSRHLDQLDPLRQERVLLLLALGLRDDDDSPVALGVADDGEADPGVAGRALDDNAARLQQPLGFGILDDGKCRAVLDAAPWVHELALAQDFAARLVREVVEPDEGRVTDECQRAGPDVHSALDKTEVSLTQHVEGDASNGKDMAERVAGLLAPPVERVDTHAAVILLSGDRAFKLKKPVAFSFLDFTTLDSRRAALEAELRLNLRTAPMLYEGVVPVCETASGALALDGAGEPVEWLLVMRRFPERCRLDHVASAASWIWPWWIGWRPALPLFTGRWHRCRMPAALRRCAKWWTATPSTCVARCPGSSRASRRAADCSD